MWANAEKGSCCVGAGYVEKGKVPKGTSLTWAEKARGRFAADPRHGDKNGKNGHCNVPCAEPESGNYEGIEKEQQQYNNNFLAPLCILPMDAWDIISSFLNFRDIELMGNTCRFFWVQLHKLENIWRCQLEYFRRDMKELRGDGGLLCTEFLNLPTCSAYEQMKFEHKLYAIDARREWHFHEQVRADRASGILSLPLTFVGGDNNSDSYNHNVSRTNEESSPLLQICVLRPVPRNLSQNVTGNDVTDNNQCTNGMRSRMPSILTASECLTVCDSINHRDFTGSRNVVQDCTADEDELFLFALLQTLRLAKRRAPRRSSGTEVITSCNPMLRHFSGILLAICRYEAEQILQTVLHMRNVVDDFVIFNDSSQFMSRNLAEFTPSLQTRYFIAPELCRHGRVGLILVDPIRVMVVVGKECITHDNPQWDEEYTRAVQEGRTPQGGGMNPQPLRRA